MRHTISVLVENKPGVLARISSLFSARGFNIDSLAVGETEDPQTSRMTIVVKGDDSVLEQITKQLNKLIDVIKVSDFTDIKYVERGLALIRINAGKANRGEIIELANIFRTRIIDIASDSLMLEVTGDKDKLEAFIKLVSVYGIKEMCRTGEIALARGDNKRGE
ncbi:MAG: acetolactate synthase small subunit [Elusimicrobiota bacterium]|jgi:acetolactate synthase-1/3 small subunit|nr:acetolactate synthase small subunit [Elusimicrobiota bacterium]